MNSSDAKRLISGSSRVALQVAQKQLGWYSSGKYPVMPLYLFLHQREARFHEAWFEQIEFFVHEDIDKTMSEALKYEHGRALRVLQRSL